MVVPMRQVYGGIITVRNLGGAANKFICHKRYIIKLPLQKLIFPKEYFKKMFNNYYIVINNITLSTKYFIICST